jgi:hypothetical protein
MQNEVNKLEAEVNRLQNQLTSSSSTSQVSFELYKESLEAEKAQVMKRHLSLFFHPSLFI